ncbi:Hypothetical predicted protein [Paramuricea clavata]|uniref:Uncharacterized protein n=1 Tax=Paramuricea clavata TaxID=317549 RepID=A0A6S7JWP9_PARCT|nr:Hypothetical predicted protein [Paramuricea clavata]
MESCFKLLSKKGYNKYCYMLLAVFMFIGIIVIGIATALDLKATLHCKPDESLASDLKTKNFVEPQCLLKYAQEFHPSIPLYVLIILNFGLVLLFNVIYAWWVKDRVEIFAEPPCASTISNGAKDESQPLLDISRAASDPMACKKPGGHIIFTVYIMHLIFCRIIPLVVFAIFLLTSSNFPVQYDCPWPMKTTSTPHANFTQNESMNFSTVDCTYPMGSIKEKVAATVVAIDFFIGSVACMELAYLLWSTWKDNNLLTDLEFCSVYLLRKRKRIRKIMKTLREKILPDTFCLHDGQKRSPSRELEEMYVNVIIHEGRETTWTSRRRYKNRHKAYEAYFEIPAGAYTPLTRMADLFMPMSKNHPKTILVVGRPGIGKTVLTKKIFYQWKKQEAEFWHDKITFLIRFRTFYKKKWKTSLREMLRKSKGFKMSSAEFKAVYEYTCLFPCNIILIFDGLDEVKFDDESFTEEEAIDGHNDVKHILLIFKQLMKGELLPGVTVLTTSRPTAEHIYQELKFDREVEIFMRNKLTMCLTLKESIDIDKAEAAEGQSNVPRTITELYKRAIKILLFRNHAKYRDNEETNSNRYIKEKFPENLKNDLKKLKEIAKNGMKEDQLVFDEDQLVFDDDADDHTELSKCGLFNQSEDNDFCFLHLTIQEFLAALDVVDDLENVDSFLSKHIGYPRWHLVIQFVAGLIGDKMREMEKQRKKLQRSPNFTNNERAQELAKNDEIIDCICKRQNV